MRNSTRARAILVAVAGALIAMGTPTQAEAQGAVITGKVTSEFGSNVEGANVYINDMGISILTNVEGNYTITFPAARVNGQLVNLRVRAVGYQPQVRPVRVNAGTQTFNFVLKQDVNRLDEIVVTGVVEGVERAKVPFAITRLTQEELPVPALDPLRALAGKVPGVRISQTSGTPGSTPEIMMRGPTSINGSGRGQGPLIIVDGAIMNVGSIEELGGLDIESVEVVKGAAGASLYGTRAANGVITIRTKRGSTQEGVHFNVRSEYGVSDLNSLDYGMPLNHHLQLDETGTRFCVQSSANQAHCSRTLDWMTEIMRVNNVPGDTVRQVQSVQWNGATRSGAMLQNVFQAAIWPGQYYNSLAQVVSNNPVALTHVDATGRVSGVRFYVSGSYQKEEGAIQDLDGIQQRRGRVNLDYDVRSDLLVSVSSLYDNGVRDLRTGGSGNGGTIFGQLLRGAPPGTDYTAVDTLGRPIILGGGAGLRGSGNGTGSFLYDAHNDNLNDTRYSNRFLGTVNASYFPTDWVTFEGNFAYDNRVRRDEFWLVKGYRTVELERSENDGQMSVGNRFDESMNTSFTANFRHQITTDLNGKFTARALYDEQNVRNNSSDAEIFRVKDVYSLDNTSENFDAASSAFTIKNTGFLVGANLDYKDRYILDGTFRYDGSSLFGSGNRWAPFNRISGVWRVSQEEFWNVPVMDEFRLRASRGTAGSTPRFEAQYETYNVGSGGISLGQAGNSKLKPETTTEYEFGTDLTLFGRVGLELTHARSKTEDQILLVATPASLGFSEQWQNAGTLQNRTWELAVNLPIMNRREFSWSMRGTWDRNRTHVSELFVPEFLFNGGTNQGSGGFFRITDSAQYRLPDFGPNSPNSGRSLTNGFDANRFGNIWGRKFYRGCGDLPGAALQAQCGDGRAFQVNDQGYVVWVGAGNSWREGITKNLWQTILPGSLSPWGDFVPLYWGMPIIDRPLRGEPNEGAGIRQVLGNVFPDFRFSISNNMQYKRLTLYALLDATMGHDVFNQGEQWGLFDFNSANFDNAGRTVETAKPLGYGWRTGPSEAAGIGGFYDVLGPNNYSVEDASFAKIRELSLTYRVGPVRGVGDWTVGFVGRNLFTFTNYSGYDPEVGVSGGSTGSGLINQVDAFDFPTLRTYTMSLSTRF